ncbi:MAG: hypothetical protein IKM06_04110 [Clostridia bacterium]|nr:hypothetical protein [Clostridia bacterium]
MKKLLAVLLVVALALSAAVTVFAADSTTKVTAEWQKLLGNTDVTKSTEGGETVYTFGGIDMAFKSAGVNLFPDLQKLIKGKSSITVKVTMDAKVTFNAGYEGEEFPVAMIIRVGGTTNKVASEDAFKANFQDKVNSAIHSVDANGNFGIVFEQEDVLTETWETLETPEFKLTPDDLNTDFWSQLNLCFHRMNEFEMCKTISVKNTAIVVVDGTAGNDKPTITDDGNKSETVGAVNGNDEDTPELPEGNYLKSAWVKGLGASTVSTGTFKDQTTHVFKGMNNSYASPYLDIYGAVKSALGDEDEVEVWFVLDVRIANKADNAGDEHKFGMKIRPTKGGKLLSEEDALDEYEGSLFVHSTGGVSKTILSAGAMMLTESWQRIEISLTVYGDDINDAVFDAWNVCFDNMETYQDIVEIQVKNAGIFLDDDYEPIEVEEDEDDNGGDGGAAITTTPKPVTIYKPFNFDKYSVTFREAVSSDNTPAPTTPDSNTPGSDTSVSATPDADGNIPKVTEGAGQSGDPNQDNGEGGSSTLIIIIVAAAVVVLAGAAAAFIIIKKKKGGKAE